MTVNEQQENLPCLESREKLLEGKIAFVTGANRGIGAEIAKALAKQGANIISPHRDEGKHSRAEKVQQEVEKLGGGMDIFTADITSSDDMAAIYLELSWIDKPVDFLIHNAAGGLEDWATEEYAYQINATAKSNLTRLVSEHNNEFNTGLDEKNALLVIDIPSLWSLEYGLIDQLPTYDLVAETKYEGMKQLRATVDELNENEQNDIRLGMVCGHGIGDTFTMRMFRRMNEEKIAKVEKTATGSVFPTMQDMAEAVVNVTTKDVPDGHIEFVGIPHWDQETVKQKLSIYGDNARFIDTIVFFGNEGFAEYTLPETYKGEPYTTENGALLCADENIYDPWTINTYFTERSNIYVCDVTEKHTEGHFTPESGISLLPGHKQIAAMVQSSQMLFLDQLNGRMKPRVHRLENVRFHAPGFPGDQIHVSSETSDTEALTATAFIKTNDEELSSVGTITFHPILWEEGDERKKNIDLDIERYVEEILRQEKEHEFPTNDETLTYNDIIEAAAQALGGTYLVGRGEGDLLPLFEGLDQAQFAAIEVQTGETIRTHVEITESDAKSFVGNATMYKDLDQIATITGLRCSIVPKSIITRYFRQQQKIQS